MAAAAEKRGNEIVVRSELNSSSNSKNKDIIRLMPEEHLVSILLLLPIESIVWFGMSCKRFKSLVCESQSLWESLCKRDWGYTTTISSSASSAAAASSSSSSAAAATSWNCNWNWRQVYQRIRKLDSLSCTQLSPPPPPPPLPHPTFPGPRASHSLNFVSGSLLLFGGGSDGGRHLDDTWIGYLGNDLKRILKWQKVNSGIPSGRFGHSCVVNGDHLVLFGGINDDGIRQNDTWIGEVDLHGTFRVTLSWRLLDVGSVVPPPRGAHAGCSIHRNRMLIHGGIGLSGLRLGDTWVLDLSNNRLFGTWHEVVAHPSPTARSGHTLTYISETQVILFAGRGLGYEVLNDVWLFDTSEGHFRWKQLLYELRNVSDGLSLPRVGHSATHIIGGRVLIHGGEDTYRRRKNDFWVLDINARPSITKQPVTSNRRECIANMWRRLKSEGYTPNCRSFHRACSDYSGRYLFIFGGMSDGLLQPAEAFGLRFNGELFLVELVI